MRTARERGEECRIGQREKFNGDTTDTTALQQSWDGSSELQVAPTEAEVSFPICVSTDLWWQSTQREGT